MRDNSTPSTLTQWPRYDATSQQFIRLHSNQSLIESCYVADRVHFWNSLAPVLMDHCDTTDCSPCGQDNTVGAASHPQIHVASLMIYVFTVILIV